MRILLVEPMGQWEGHPSMRTKYLSYPLADAGCDVTLLTFDGVLGNWTENDTKIKHTSFLSKIGIFAFPFRLLHPLHRFTGVATGVLAIYTFFTFLLAFRQIRQQRYDVIHVLDGVSFISFYFAFASFLSGCNVVFNLYTPLREQGLEGWYEEFKASLRRRNYGFCGHLLLARLERSRLVTAVNSFLYRKATRKNHIAFVCQAKEIQDLYKHNVIYDKLYCILLGRPKPETRALTQQQARQYLGLAMNDRVFLCFGVSHPLKSYEVIFQAVQGLPRNFKLLFAGRILYNDAKTDPKQLAQKYGWEGNTIITDKYIPEEEMPYYFYAADALILTYSKEFSGESSLLLHGGQYTVPVIASDLGLMGEFVRRYNLGLTFAPEDPVSLRQAILSFLSLGEDEKQVFKGSLAEFTSTRSWNDTAKDYLTLYQSLSGKNEL